MLNFYVKNSSPSSKLLNFSHFDWLKITICLNFRHYNRHLNLYLANIWLSDQVPCKPA